MVGGEGTTVVAFDKYTGKEIWKSLTCKDLGYCPPMIYQIGGKRQLIIWHGEAVNGLDPESGSVYWTEPAKTYMAMSISTPRQLGDTLFLTSTFGGVWLMRLKPDGAGAEVVWKGDKKIGFDSVFGTPYAEDGYIYGSRNSGPDFCCIKADTGERLWNTMKPNGDKKLASADVFIIKNGDRFFLWTEQGDLVIAKLSPKGYEELSRAHLIDPTSAAFGRDVLWCHPAFANRCMFVRNDKELICVSLAATPK
jgi:outer membrane protein assembly factor BamB